MTTALGGNGPAAVAASSASVSDLRAEAERWMAAGEAGAAAAALTALWTREPTPSTAAFVVPRFEQLRGALALPTYRVALLRSFTVEPVVPLLRAGAFAGGFDLAVHVSDFNAYAQELLDPASPLYAFGPDAAILAVQTRDVAPELWRDFVDFDPAAVDTVVDRVVTELSGLIDAFRANSAAHLIVHNLEQPVIPASGALDAQTPHGQAETIRRIDRELQAAAARHRGVFILDYDALIARHGRLQWHDERKWLTVRLPVAAAQLNHLAAEWLRFLHPLAGRSAKALVVDLDNTLWGGVVGEDGIDGIKLGAEYPGAAFRDLQRALLDVRQRGVVLAICSKNNPDEAMNALNRHPGMLLKASDFAAIRIDWNDKPSNLRAIAQELSVGLDAIAFLDDNPVERAAVRQQLPDVHVIELPGDPMQYARAVRDSPLLQRLALSAEDRARGGMYDAQRERRDLMQRVASCEDFYRSLDQEADVEPVTGATLARVAQLTGKTNQFNLTTRRYSERQIQELLSGPGWAGFSIRVRDRFGDNGLVGVAFVHTSGEICEIDTFLLSCRVIGRTVETAFLSFLADHARRSGAAALQGWFLPTKKNAPASDFYPAHGFVAVQENEHGTLWRLPLADAPVRCPEWVRLHVMEREA